jgi:hypothetical protein
MQGARRIVTQSPHGRATMRPVAMNVRRVVWFGLAVLAVATWLASASTSGVRSSIAPPTQREPDPLDRSSAALQSEMTRLHDRVGPTATPTKSRDLFHFNVRAMRRPVAAAPQRTDGALPVEAAAPRPVLKLIGIAEDESENGSIRTAIVSGLGDLFLVKTGETIAGQYHVDQISADAVQITDTRTSALTTLVLR